MKSSDSANEQAKEQAADIERVLVAGDADATPEQQAPAFDRKNQGAPRADDANGYQGQVGYGGLAAPELKTVPPERGTDHPLAPGQGGLSTYGSGLGGQFSIDNEPGSSARTPAPVLSHAGRASGAAAEGTNVGRYGGEYDDGGEISDGGTETSPDSAAQRTSQKPSAYQPARSDRQVHEEIAQRLRERSDLEMRDVSVLIHDGKVILKGSVPDPKGRHIIEDIADNVAGVIAIDNRLEIRRIADQVSTFASGYTAGQSYAASIPSPGTPSETGPPTFGAATANATEDKKHGSGGAK